MLMRGASSVAAWRCGAEPEDPAAQRATKRTTVAATLATTSTATSTARGGVGGRPGAAATSEPLVSARPTPNTPKPCDLVARPARAGRGRRR